MRLKDWRCDPTNYIGNLHNPPAGWQQGSGIWKHCPQFKTLFLTDLSSSTTMDCLLSWRLQCLKKNRILYLSERFVGGHAWKWAVNLPNWVEMCEARQDIGMCAGEAGSEAPPSWSPSQGHIHPSQAPVWKGRRKSFSFEHLKALKEIEEGSQLLRENLERDELKLSHTFRQRFSSIKSTILIPVLPEINRSSSNVPYKTRQCFTWRCTRWEEECQESYTGQLWASSRPCGDPSHRRGGELISGGKR